MEKTKENLDKIVFKTRLGRISLRQCRKVFQLIYRKPMPDSLPYVDALFLAVTKAGDDKVVNIIRAIDRIDGDKALMAGWGD